MNKYQDAVATAYPEGPEYLDEDEFFLPEVLEYHEVLGTGDIDEGNT